MTERVAELLRELALDASIEVTPRHAGSVAELGDALRPGTRVYITALPGADSGDLARAAATVREAGHVPVPHLAARGISGDGELDDLLGRLVSEAAVDDVLVVAGGITSPAGAYEGAMDVLRSGLLERHGIVRAGVAGHPEGSPDVSPQAMRDALAEKNAFAQSSSIELRIVTQFALAAAPYVEWERRVREEGNRLPVVAGLPGVTSPATLLKYALACGIGASIDVLRKQAGGLLKLATTRIWTPDAVAEGIAAGIDADPDCLFRGLHLFPFGGIDRSAAWLAGLRATRPAVTAGLKG